MQAAKLYIPDVTDLGVIKAGFAYAEAGFYLVPVDPRTKHPGSVLGKGWPATSSREPKVIADWLILENRAIALHCGKSGLVVFDVDRPKEVPAPLWEFLDRAPFQSTRSNVPDQGHYFFAMPPGRMIGNSKGGVSGGWGEIRGKNGIVMLEPSPHTAARNGGCYRFVRTGLVHSLPDEVARLLHEAPQADAAATSAEVDAFIQRHGAESHPHLLEPVLESFKKHVADGHSRHDSAVRALTWGLREAAAGLYCASRVIRELRSLFVRAIGTDRDPTAEFSDMVAWGVAQAQQADPNETRRDTLRRVGLAQNSGSGIEESVKKKSQSTRLVELATESYALGCSDGQAFVVPRNGAQVALLLESARSSLKSELSSRYYEVFGSVPTTHALNDALNSVEGMARAKPDREALHRRVANHNGEIWIDPGDTTGLAIRVTRNGWSLEEPPVLFVRSKASRALPVPARGGDFEDLRKFLNVSTNQWPLLVAWLVAAFIPDIPHPLLNINGEHGSGKSMFTRLLVRLLDPSAAGLRAIPRNLEDWAVSANDSYVVALDNVSAISPDMSDALCRAVTGEAIVRRKLYTDSETTVLSFRRVVIINNIGLSLVAGDLADRMLSIELEAISNAARVTEKELIASFEREYPRILGALLDLVAETLKALPEVQLDSHPRMADFAEIVAAVDAVRGTDGLKTYLAQGGEHAMTVIEGDVVGSTLRSFLDEFGSWSGSASELLKKIEGYSPAVGSGRDWPNTPEAMGKTLTQLAPDLRHLGYTVEQSRSSKGRTWDLAAPPEARPKGKKPRGRRVVRRQPV